MANFDLDDPLGDLLSDGSNDSFFEDPKPKRSSFRKSPEKKSVSDLFGLDLDKPATVKKESTSSKDDWLEISNKPITTPSDLPLTNTRPQTAKPIKKISFEDDSEDLFGNSGLDIKKPAAELNTKTPSRKSDFMDDLFASTRPKLDDSKPGGLFDDLMPQPKTETIVKSGYLGETPKVIDQTTISLDKPQTKGFMSLESTGREPRRSRTPVSLNLDPLGLLGATSNENISEQSIALPKRSPLRRQATQATQEQIPDRPRSARNVNAALVQKDMKAKSATNITNLPDWLSVAKVKSNASEMSLDKLDDSNHQRAIIQTPLTQNLPLRSDNQITPEPLQSALEDTTVLKQQKMTSANVEYQNTAIALHQQESQVLMALQLRKYENNMAEMQRHQQEILIKQEQCFNTLLDRQFAKQQLIENNIRLQQERINNHIQLLITNPAKSDKETEDKEKSEFEHVKSGNQEDLKVLYDGMVAALKERHKEEMFLMEESYKKQLSTLEQSMEALENRLKQELDSISIQSSAKIEVLKEEHSSELLLFKNKIADIKMAHNSELTMLRENQNRVIDEIQYEHNTILENVKQSRNVSNAIVDDAGSYTQKLDLSLKMLEVNSRNLQEMQENVGKKFGVFTMAREESMKAKEEDIRLMRLALDQAREEANSERSQLMTLVRTLEQKLAQQSQDSREERYAFQQATSILTARTAALDRETEFNRNSLEREREQLKTLREQILMEQEQSILSLNEEKLGISTERAKLEISRKLSANSFAEQRSRAEVEAAVQVAKDAAEMADLEREQLQRRITEMETYKRTIVDKERKLNVRERELDALQRCADSRGKEGEEALMEAQLLRCAHNQRLKELQKQLKSLSLREKRLTEDKIAVSKERLSLHTLNKRINRCSLCKVEQTSSPDRNSIGNYQGIEEGIADDEESVVEHDNIPKFIAANDADIFRLQLKQSEDQLTSNINGQDENEIYLNN